MSDNEQWQLPSELLHIKLNALIKAAAEMPTSNVLVLVRFNVHDGQRPLGRVTTDLGLVIDYETVMPDYTLGDLQHELDAQDGYLGVQEGTAGKVTTHSLKEWFRYLKALSCDAIVNELLLEHVNAA